MVKSNYKTVVISTLDNFGKKGLSISIPETKISILGTKELNVARIGTDAYWTACKLKEAQTFAVSIRDLEYQAE